jgi:hypothetical protein
VRSKIGDVFLFFQKIRKFRLNGTEKSRFVKMFSQKNYLIATKFPEKRADVKL